MPFAYAMQPYAERFYKSIQWRTTRDAYAKSVGLLCERCKAKGIIKAGEIVHHKVHLTPDNINNPEVSLAWSNLMLLCRDCHGEIHSGREDLPYTIGKNGEVIVK